ncbi:SusC/RagA family TonB-linked outer membrane protein [Fulvivirgaceae bacterium BMA10]|uniref:SusC/RagA family TonB-linked outer membrane protein n=1 Tax=Splendidivirga corallicola TaxID=3051826 RepID=A0ABT8KU89_9BACT|nr:SusC/RagA family TonB-linked outer membrane protein [Fulvivirgaceae bacterium BMA10]
MKRNLLKLIMDVSKHSFYIFIIQIVSMQFVLANESLGQSLGQVEVSISARNASLEDILSMIEGQTDFVFVAQGKAIESDYRIDLKLKKSKLKHVLEKLSEEFRYNFKRINKNIYVWSQNNPKRRFLSKDEYLQWDRDISGKVTDETGTGLPGVNVLIKDRSIGTITDSDGKYRLTIPDDATTIVFSYIGYVREEVEIEGRSIIDMTLTPDVSTLSEIVVVGYQTKEKKNITGAVATIKADQIKDRPTARTADLLAGLAPGLVVTRRNPGRVGGGEVDIQIQGTVARSNSGALVVIDGVPQPAGATAAINSVNPNDIESITILKDGEGVVYGSRAAAGVIVITTKSGDKARVNAGFTTTFRTPSIQPVKTNVIQMYTLWAKAWELNGDSPFFGHSNVINYIQDNNLTFDQIKDNNYLDPNYPHIITGVVPWPDTPYLVFSHTDWFEEMYGTAVTRNYDLSASGSTEKLRYYLSLGVADEGTLLQYGDNSNLTTFGRAKLDYAFNDIITVGTNINLRYQKLIEPWDMNGLESIISLRHTYDVPFSRGGRYSSWGGFQNPIGHATDRGSRTVRLYTLHPQIYTEITPIEQLSLRASFQKSAVLTNDRWSSRWYNIYRFGDEFAFPTFGNRDDDTQSLSANRFDQNFNGTFSANFQETFAEDHTIRAFTAYTHEEFQRDLTVARARGLAFQGLTTVNLGDTERPQISDDQEEIVLKGLVSNLSYSFQDRYSVEGYYRRDGSSRFAEGFKWSDFFGAGVAWTVTNEDFFVGLGIENIVSNLKLRANWGQLGNQGGIAPYDFVQNVNIYQSNVLFGAPSSVARAQAASLGGFPSNTRTWQVAEKLNFGVDLNLLNNRLGIVFNTYKTKTENAFFLQEFPSVLGANPPSINGANFEVKGWDLGVNWNDSFDNGLSYFAAIGINNANTKAISLADDVIPGIGRNTWVEGYPLGATFGLRYDGIMQTQGEVDAYYDQITGGGITSLLLPGDVRFKDLDGDGIIERRLYEVDENGNPTAGSGDMVYLGDSDPHYQYYINLGASYKGFEIGVVLNGVGEWNLVQRDRANGAPWIQPLEHIASNPGWTPENPNAEFPRLNIFNNAFSNAINNHNYTPSDAPFSWVNVPWLGIKNVQIAYNLPEQLVSRLRLSNVRVFANGTDLGYIINKMPKSFSPEQPFNASLAPYTRNYSIGINVGF